MRRFILTGAPGAGKTTLIRHFEGLGRFVVHEAATEIIRISQANGVKEPWAHPSFTEEILEIQSERQTIHSRQALRSQCSRSRSIMRGVCTQARWEGRRANN